MEKQDCVSLYGTIGQICACAMIHFKHILSCYAIGTIISLEVAVSSDDRNNNIRFHREG